ncbi:class F sortase [Knoellia subterranea]|uniref:Peptidase C60 n=1 Tax=Knoellia subterranea KCTC 19937 TaxID=1385521 RepID=A0A0A0JMG0_9MICO|nr:class F sortase [Knoellia subterranea]KGN38328.1 hypothetical protein N803_10045 [Knoellia subterranea KCTC 19937]
MDRLNGFGARWRRPVFIALAVAVLGGCSGESSKAPRSTPTSVTATGVPMTMSAPTINVSGPLKETVAKDGVVNPPTMTLAWVNGYERVRPGDVGTAVIAGHVVDGTKPDIFANLDKVTEGDPITVVDAAGKSWTYTVTRTRIATKKDVSHDPDVWGQNDSVRRIALITCDDDDGFRADGHRVANFVAIAEAA